MASKHELLQAYVDLWSELGEPPGPIKMNLKGEFYALDYNDKFDEDWKDLPDLCRSEHLIDTSEFEDASEGESDRNSTESANRPNGNDPGSPGQTPKVSDIDLANAPLGPPSSVSISIDLFQLHRRLGRPLKVTDLATFTDLSAEDVRDQFDSWSDAGEHAQVPVENLSWQEAIVRELQYIQSQTGNDVRSFESLRQLMEHRLALLFPEWGGDRDRLRDELTEIAGEPHLDYDPEKDFFTLRCEPIEDSLPEQEHLEPTQYDQSLEKEREADRIAVQLRELEALCSAAERQLRYSLDDAAGDTLDKLHSELNAVEDDMDAEAIPKHLLIRHKAVGIRAESARQSDGDPDQISEQQGGESRIELTDQLRDLAETFGEAPRPVTAEMCGEYAATAYIEEFGSWPEAIDAAGLDQIDEEARERRMYDRIMVLNELVRLTEKFGRVPAYSEVRRHTDFTATTAGNRLGSWPDAEEFARSIADVDTEPESIERTPSSKLRHSGDDRGVERRLDNLDILGEIQNELSDM